MESIEDDCNAIRAAVNCRIQLRSLFCTFLGEDCHRSSPPSLTVMMQQFRRRRRSQTQPNRAAAASNSFLFCKNYFKFQVFRAQFVVNHLGNKFETAKKVHLLVEQYLDLTYSQTLLPTPSVTSLLQCPSLVWSKSAHGSSQTRRSKKPTEVKKEVFGL